MKTQSQLEWTKKQLLENGFVSRNDALKQFFTRLGARIKDLQNEGWNIEGEWVKTSSGKDYIYRLINSPLKKVVFTVNGKIVATSYEPA